MVIFHSYVKLPEGTNPIQLSIFGSPLFLIISLVMIIWQIAKKKLKE